MSLFPRFTNEFAPLFRLFDEYDRQAFPSGVDRHLSQTLRSFTPKFDVKETQDTYELHGELPGIEQKAINIEWTDNNTLTVSGRHEHVREEEERGARPKAFVEEAQTEAQTASKGAIENRQPSVQDGDEDSAAEVAATQGGKQDLTKSEVKKARYWVSERSVGEFHRSFAFPARVDQDAVKASLKDGILSIVVPKMRAPVARRIEIE